MEQNFTKERAGVLMRQNFTEERATGLMSFSGYNHESIRGYNKLCYEIGILYSHYISKLGNELTELDKEFIYMRMKEELAEDKFLNRYSPYKIYVSESHITDPELFKVMKKDEDKINKLIDEVYNKISIDNDKEVFSSRMDKILSKTGHINVNLNKHLDLLKHLFMEGFAVGKSNREDILEEQFKILKEKVESKIDYDSIIFKCESILAFEDPEKISINDKNTLAVLLILEKTFDDCKNHVYNLICTQTMEKSSNPLFNSINFNNYFSILSMIYSKKECDEIITNCLESNFINKRRLTNIVRTFAKDVKAGTMIDRIDWKERRDFKIAYLDESIVRNMKESSIKAVYMENVI